VPFETFKGTLVAPTVTGAQTVTGVPFQPKAVIFFCTCLASGAADTDVYLTCCGAATSSAQEFTIANAENGSTSSNAGRAARTDASICMPLNGNFAADAVADFTAFTSDGFTINWSDAAASANMLVHYFCLGGTDLTNAKVGAHTIVRTTAGTEATTGVGFQPDCVLFWSPAVPNAASIVDSTMCHGAATSTASRFAWAFFENDAAATMDTFQRRSITKCLVLSDATSVIDGEADLSSFDSDGFTLNWTDPVAAASSRVFYYLALKGGGYAVGADSTPTTTGVQAVTTGFQPSGVLLSWLNRTMAVDTSTTAAGDAGFGFGAFDSALTDGLIAVNETDADAVSQSWRAQTITASVRLLKGLRAAKATRAQAQADGGALTSTGFQLNWTAVDAAAYQYHYVAFGNTPVVVAPPDLLMAPPLTEGRV
jgi:hypothetical protein